MKYEQENFFVVNYYPIKKGKNIKIQWNRLDNIFDFYKDNSFFKKRDAMALFFVDNLLSDIHSISTKEEIEDKVTIRIVQFKNDISDYKFLYQILSKIDLKSIHEIRFKKTLNQQLGIKKYEKLKKNEVQILISSGISDKYDHEKIQPELKRIIEHLHTTIEQENSKKAMDKCINSFPANHFNFISIHCLNEIYEKVLLWGRNDQRELLNDKTREDFFEKLVMEHKELLIWFLGSKPPNIDDFIPTKKDRSKQMYVKKLLKDKCYIEDSMKAYQLKAFISHAMFIADKIKCSKYVPNRENKRKKAHQMWKQYIARKIIKKSKKSQREIAEEVGVSLGTLNSWFKEFNQFKEFKK